MIEIMQFYVSGFWVWLGITCGLWVCVVGLAIVVDGITTSIRAIRPSQQKPSITPGPVDKGGHNTATQTTTRPEVPKALRK